MIKSHLLVLSKKRNIAVFIKCVQREEYSQKDSTSDRNEKDL